jgi:glycine cleavage system transcriptional repressor
MTQQLIITILGANEFGMLSTIADTVCEVGCNILDSRQALFGQDFSLTLIIEGTQSAIVQAELAIPVTCQKHNLLSMMKRTKKHSKQHLETLADVIITGVSIIGVVKQITGFFSEQQISVSALRLKTLEQAEYESKLMKCKMVVSMPHSVNVEDIEQRFQALLVELNLTGSIKQNH